MDGEDGSRVRRAQRAESVHCWFPIATSQIGVMGRILAIFDLLTHPRTNAQPSLQEGCSGEGQNDCVPGTNLVI